MTATKSYNRSFWLGIARAWRLACPRCGSGGVFRRFFVMNETCRRCGLRFDRGDGYWLGAMVLNMAVGMGAVLGAFLLTLLATSPDPNWDVAIAVSVGVGLIVPLLFFPFSRVMWMAAERAARLRHGGTDE